MAEVMTLKDLALYLRMNERTVAKLVQEGRVPGFKVASQWRFSREAIDAWMRREMQGAGAPSDEVVTPRISALLAKEAMNLELKSRTKDGVLVEMTEMLSAAGRVSDPERLLAALRERERLCSTGIGRGVAFLHPRRVLAGIVKEPVLGFGKAPEGVEFEAVDGEPVRLFLLDCAPSERMHLAVLARLSRLLADRATLEAVLAAESPEAVTSVVSAAEDRLV